MGHTGHPENERCDALAREAVRGIKSEKKMEGINGGKLFVTFLAEYFGKALNLLFVIDIQDFNA